ncbi:membrane dipeptidase [Cryobacterium flavum]|uniref:Membrane dipeptidase n=1 Tax=Cryobacterium flavum TaxID=1424659 RepID=A0A4R8V6L1_9MICO|nr:MULTISPECIES: dipeptidase [Cryobacterium]TFB78292.1 membrane dipeptidase [Cryobacterium flavum]TFB78536.1 membrane dipeptidase [Cryobacterium flavum]SDO36134.1 membrane dipeptidase [Cryobacterium flavum]
MTVRKPKFDVIDGHNDLAWACREHRDYSVAGLDSEQDSARNHLQTDVPKLRRGGVQGQFWSVWVHTDLEGTDSVQATLEQIDFIHRLIAAYPDDFERAVTADDVERARHGGKIASLLGVEGGNQMNNSLAVLREYARLGVRYMTLTWNSSTEWADAAAGEVTHDGINERGRVVIAEMNRIGMMVDLSHVSAATMQDALDASTLPVLFSHSSCYALNPHPRNVPDAILSQLAANGGVQMITFVPAFISADYRRWEDNGSVAEKPQITVAHVADHVEHARSVAGVDHIGLGGDFDGCPDMPVGLATVADYPNLFTELERRGWTDAELAKLGSENVLRVLRANDAAYRAFVA